ncbi:response regulator [Thalassoroseus pseudoceratinae]|uniref:response regulator n=1 Tax=Thalassoroseus pseudoceratinae TaxID=2713176 RepID=UPI00141F5461|nr:response regulator [Thalassoroseus pseudoceratinae]
MSQDVGSEILEQGIQTARDGHRLLARLHLEQASQDDPQNPDVWMWLAWVADSPTEAAKLLRQAAEVAPTNATVTAGLRWLESLSGELADECEPAPMETSEVAEAESTPNPGNLQGTHWSEPSADQDEDQSEDDELTGDDNCETYEWSVDELLESSESEWKELDDSEVGEILELAAEPEVLEVTDDEPLKMLEVVEVLNEEPADAHESDADVEEANPEPQTPRVLLLDASPTFRQLATLALQRAGYDVEATDDETYALEHLSDIEPNVILVDSATPNVGGYQWCKTIKKHAETRHIPVLLLSGEDKLFDRMRGRLSGCAGSLSKPVSWENLIAKVGRHVASC